MTIDKPLLKQLAMVLKDNKELHSAYQKASSTIVPIEELMVAANRTKKVDATPSSKLPNANKKYVPLKKSTTNADRIQKDALAKLCEVYARLKPLNSSMEVMEIGRVVHEVREDLLKFTKEKV